MFKSVQLEFCILAVLGTFSEAAPAPGDGRWPAATTVAGVYELVQRVLVHDSADDPVGYGIAATLTVDRVHDSLLLVEVESPRLDIMSRRAPTPRGFVGHGSRLDSMPNRPFVVRSADAKLQSLHVHSAEHVSMVNLKRGIASLLQFQISNSETDEIDSSGLCSVVYSFDDSTNSVTKTKRDCRNPKLEKMTGHKMARTLWGGKLESNLKTVIKFIEGVDDHQLESVVAEESHVFEASISSLTVTKVTTRTELKLKDSRSDTDRNYYTDDIDSALSQIGSELGLNFINYDPIAEKETTNLCNDEACPSLAKLFADNRKNLRREELGGAKSASALVKLVDAVRSSTAEEIYGILKAKENKKIMPQLMDVLGAAQTDGAHQAALKKLKINTEYDLDLAERYLWSMSISPKPNESIIRDLLKIVTVGHKDEKLYETLVLTLSAMAHKYGRLYGDEGVELVDEVASTLKAKLEKCERSDENCRQLYLRGFANIAARSQLATLLDHAVNSTRRSNVAAVYAVSRLGVGAGDGDVLKACERIYLSAGKRRYDSSARTIALDVLLGSRPSDVLLARLLSPIGRKSTPTELKQYLLQRLAQISERDDEFRAQVKRVMYAENLLHYDGVAQGGLSTAFDREFMPGGALSTTQEVANGILKRGRVGVELGHGAERNSVFTLGLFSSGLGSFVSGNSDGGDEVDGEVIGREEEEDQQPEEEEESSAGMQLTVMGVELRPFVFFRGNSELIGHVWSGTASSKTPAYQALALIGDEEVTVNLGCGFVADLRLTAVASVDLSGQIEISLWNKNARSVVQNSAGLAVGGVFRVESHFVKSLVEFDLSAEPSLDLTSDIGFYDGVQLCLQLKQPDTTIRFNTYKIERIPGSKHKLRKTRYRTIHVPGKTYALNDKNNEMCNAIHDINR